MWFALGAILAVFAGFHQQIETLTPRSLTLTRGATAAIVQAVVKPAQHTLCKLDVSWMVHSDSHQMRFVTSPEKQAA